MGSTSRQVQKCTATAPVPDAILSEDVDGWWRAAYASDASTIGRKRLGADRWRANHAGGSGHYTPRPSDYLRLARLGLSPARIIALCDDLKARLLAAVVVEPDTAPLHRCTARVARETGEAVEALCRVYGDDSADMRSRARREVAEARVELDRVSLALCVAPLRRGRAD